MTYPRPVLVSNLLPADARDALVNAAATDPDVPCAESRLRRCNVDEAIARVKLKYPQFFKEEQVQ